MSDQPWLNINQFSAGKRVVVSQSNPLEGTDHDFHGMRGIVVQPGDSSALVQLDSPRRGRRNPVVLCCHSLRLES